MALDRAAAAIMTGMRPELIGVCEDDAELRSVLVRALRDEGFGG